MNFWSSLKEFVHNKILEHRESTRAQIRAVEFNLATVLSVIPFLLGFYYFLDKKYPTDKKILFFAKNFPVISPPIEKMNWDTFQYFWKNSNKANFQKSRLPRAIGPNNPIAIAGSKGNIDFIKQDTLTKAHRKVRNG